MESILTSAIAYRRSMPHLANLGIEKLSDFLDGRSMMIAVPATSLPNFGNTADNYYSFKNKCVRASRSRHGGCLDIYSSRVSGFRSDYVSFMFITDCNSQGAVVWHVEPAFSRSCNYAKSYPTTWEPAISKVTIHKHSTTTNSCDPIIYRYGGVQSAADLDVNLQSCVKLMNEHWDEYRISWYDICESMNAFKSSALRLNGCKAWVIKEAELKPTPEILEALFAEYYDIVGSYMETYKKFMKELGALLAADNGKVLNGSDYDLLVTQNSYTIRNKVYYYDTTGHYDLATGADTFRDAPSYYNTQNILICKLWGASNLATDCNGNEYVQQVSGPNFFALGLDYTSKRYKPKSSTNRDYKYDFNVRVSNMASKEPSFRMKEVSDDTAKKIIELYIKTDLAGIYEKAYEEIDKITCKFLGPIEK